MGTRSNNCYSTSVLSFFVHNIITYTLTMHNFHFLNYFIKNINIVVNIDEMRIVSDDGCLILETIKINLSKVQEQDLSEVKTHSRVKQITGWDWIMRQDVLFCKAFDDL